MKFAVAVLVLATAVSASEWYDPMGLLSTNQNQPVLAKLTPSVRNSVPANIQSQAARITGKDLLGLRSIAEKMTNTPTTRSEFIKELHAKAPNVLFLGTEVYKVGHDAYSKSRQSLSSDSLRFLKAVAAESAAAINEATALFNRQDVGTKRNLQSVFPAIPQLLQSSKNSIAYVSQNL